MSDEFCVYVVDDDEPIRDSIGMLLDTVGMNHREYPSAQDFLDGYDPSKPCCLVLDIRMPGMSGLDLQEILVERGIEIPIIFITGHGDVPMAVEAMKRGAVDFIRKPFREQELLNQINDAVEIGVKKQEYRQTLDAAQAAVDSLTAREQEVFERVAQGQANKVIAIELGISERTVEIHRSKVMHKTGSRTLADLVRLKMQLDQAGAVR